MVAIVAYLLMVTVPFFKLKYTKKVHLLQPRANRNGYPGYNPLTGVQDICGDNSKQTCSATSSSDIPLHVVQADNSVTSQLGSSSSNYVK